MQKSRFGGSEINEKTLCDSKLDSEIEFGLPSWRLEALQASKLSSLTRFRPPKEPLLVFESYATNNKPSRVRAGRRFFPMLTGLHMISSSLFIDIPPVALIKYQLRPSRSILCMAIRIEIKFRFRSARFACDLVSFWMHVDSILDPFWVHFAFDKLNRKRIRFRSSARQRQVGT